MNPIIAVIPTKNESPLLKKVIKTLDQRVHKIYVYNNSDKKDIGLPPWVETIHTPKLSIYEMWNRGIELADYEFYKPHILILNDDIEFEPHVPSVLSAYLLRDPLLAISFPDDQALFDTGEYSLRYTTTTGGAGGMSGFCFMVKGEYDFRIDENLKLYWGDDDLVKQVSNRGFKIARVVGLPILHSGSYTINRMDGFERRNLMEADRRYFNQKYGESREPV